MVGRERKKRIYRKRIPYGMQNFADVIKEDCYYVDKTDFIEEIEESNKYFFYIRPRRFGKTLTLSMLENYYDINKKDQFEQLFGGLYIGENPTPERNSYLIIHLNFAEIPAGLDDYKEGMDQYCNIMFNSFCDRYGYLLPAGTQEGLRQEKSALAQLRYLCQKCTDAGQRIYLFIDEYDNYCFALKRYGRTTMYNSVMVLNFISKNNGNIGCRVNKMTPRNIYIQNGKKIIKF